MSTLNMNEFIQKKDDYFFTNIYSSKKVKDYLENYFSLYKDKLNNPNDIQEFINNDQVLQTIMTRINYDNKIKEGSENIKIAKNYLNKNFPSLVSTLSILKDETEKHIQSINDSNDMEEIVSIAENAYVTGITLPYELAEKIIKESYFEREKYSSNALKAAFISLGQEKLKVNNINDLPILFTDFEKLSDVVTYGECSKYYINLSNELIEMYLNNEDKAFETLFHEAEHAIQREQTYSDNLSFKNMMFIKDDILAHVYDTYYTANYTYIFTEIYARLAGENDYNKYLGHLFGRNPGYYNSTYYKEKIREEVERINRRTNEEMYSFNLMFEKADSKLRKELFDSYPALKVEYNKDGTRKNPLEVLKYVDSRLTKHNSFLSFFKRNKMISTNAELYSYITGYLKQNYEFIEPYLDELKEYKTEDNILNKIVSNGIDIAMKLKEKEAIEQNEWEELLNTNIEVSFDNEFHL